MMTAFFVLSILTLLVFAYLAGGVVDDFVDRVIWALFGNDEDGPIGDDRWNPERKDTLWIRVQWWLRNPFHNLTHHAIGIYGQPFTSQTEYRRGSLTKSVRVLAGRRYPYWNFNNGRFEAYLGWRSSGAFGIALRARGGSRPTV